MIAQVLIIFVSARMYPVNSFPSSTTGHEPAAIPIHLEENRVGINQKSGRILTINKNDALMREADERQTTVICNGWYLSVDGRMHCQSTTSLSNELPVQQIPKQSMHIYLPGLPSYGIPIWSTSPLSRNPDLPLVYGNHNPRGDDTNRKPAHEAFDKPIVLEPVPIIPKPIVVHKPVFVPKPIEITVHKPVLVHKPIEVHKPLVIHKPVEIPIHKPVIVQKPVLIPVHKPVVVHKPVGTFATEHSHETLLSQILRQQNQLLMSLYRPQGNIQLFNRQPEETGFGVLHQTGFVSAHDSGEESDKTSPVEESTDSADNDAPVGQKDLNSDPYVKSQTDQVVEGVFQTIQRSKDEIPETVFPDASGSLRTDTPLAEAKSGSPNVILRNTLNSTISSNMKLNGSLIPFNVYTGTDDDHLENETSILPQQNAWREEENKTEPSLAVEDDEQVTLDQKSIESEMATERTLDGGPDVIEEAQNQEGEELSRTIREAPKVPLDDILHDKRRAGTLLERTTLLEIMTVLKDQYLRNAEPDQRKLIEDAFDRLYCSVRDMKPLDERPNWKKMDGSKKAALELLTERSPVDADEWDYYSDAADEESAEPSFLELLNVATKHKGKQTEVN